MHLYESAERQLDENKKLHREIILLRKALTEIAYKSEDHDDAINLALVALEKQQ